MKDQLFTIIPAIDIIDGKCVRLKYGNFADKTIYFDDPSDAAKKFEDAGHTRLHVVDLDGAKNGSPSNLQWLEKIASCTRLSIDFGGGIKTAADITAVLSAGAGMAAIGTVAVREPQKFAGWIETFGASRLFLGADVRGTRLAVDGWQTDTDVDIESFLESNIGYGIEVCFVTDIAVDGSFEGPSLELYRRLINRFPGLELVASGGVRDLGDISALKAVGCAGVIVGKAFYEGRIPMEISEHVG